MKLTNIIIGSTIFALSSLSICTAATFKTPKNYSVVIYDGQKTNSSIFTSTKELTLTPGQHQIVVYFKGTFRNGKDSMLTSAVNPIVINIPHVNEKDNYTFSYPRISNYNQAVSFADNQVITITNNGNDVTNKTASYFILKSEKSFQLDRDFLTDLKNLNLLYVSQENEHVNEKTQNNIDNCRKSGFMDCPKEIVSPNTATNVAPATTSNSHHTKPNSNTNNKYDPSKVNNQMLEGLKSIYNSADNDTKKAFKAWLESKQK